MRGVALRRAPGRELVEGRRLGQSLVGGHLGEEASATIISSDQDLYQCLCPWVDIFHPGKELVTKADFFAEYGVLPEEWPQVKAIMGDTSDDIPGVRGVGLGYTLKYMRGELREHTKAYQKIEAGVDLWTKNLDLVKLPFPNTPVFPIASDEVTQESWDRVTGDLGMGSLIGGKKSDRRAE